MPRGFTASFAQQLDGRIPLRVVEAKHGQSLQAGVVYVAPGDQHMKIARDRRLKIVPSKDFPGPAPSADLLLNSAAETFGAAVVAIVLSGMGNDGAEGVCQVRRRKGSTIAQSEATCAVFGMPKAAIESGSVQKVIPLEAIADEMKRIVCHRATCSRQRMT